MPASLFALACVLGVTLWAPAAWLRPFIPAELACGDLTGTVWQGECRAAERINSFGARSELGRLRWKLSTSALFRLTLEAELEWQLQNLSARTVLTRKLNGRWQLRNLQLTSDYQSLGLLVDRDLRRLWSLVPKSKAITLQIPLASGTPKEIEQLQADLQFSAFGEHALTIQPNGSGELRSMSGPLQLDGPIEWQRDGRYRLIAKIRLNSDADLGLRTALASFGATNAQGDYDLTIEGSIWSLLP